MKFKERSLIVDELLRLAKESKLKSDERNEIVNLVDSLEATEGQKERFILYYELSESGPKPASFAKIGEMYGRTSSAIMVSVIKLRNKLKRVSEENIHRIEEMVKKHN
ncbi:MAG TPA: hypothetical protein OIM61_04725 [Clostridiaceae bacterium]|nr:hypothetical protein [Clostridiaceae bacterium]